MVSDERTLATWLSGRDDRALAQTLAHRFISPTVAWHDFFDAAAALLDATAIDRALAGLARGDLRALAAAADGSVDVDESGTLTALGLVAPDGAPYSAVVARVRVAVDAQPAAFDAPPAASPPDPASENEAAAAAERAFTTIGALADVLLAAAHAPLARTGAGAVSAVDRRRLMDARAVSSSEELDDLIEAAEAAGLIRPSDREWTVTTAGDRWLESPTAARWGIIAEGLRDALPSGVRTAEGAVVPIAQWPGAYPLRADWADFASRRHRIAVRVGLLTADGAEPAWTTRLRAGGPADSAALAAYLPAEIDRVYLQADLTAIAPGPLAPALDLRLRSIAARESRAQASTYRFSVATLGAGMTEGETAESIRDFLGTLSLTGIPQPLDYLIESTADRHGRVRVQWDAATARTRIDVTDPALRDSVAVDQALRPLGLLRDGDALVSRVSRDGVYWSLADARYPVVALDEHGTAEPLHRRAPVATVAQTADADAPYAALTVRLRAGEDTATDAAWLTRELDQAVRGRSIIEVDVRMPDGSARTFTVEAAGLGGGRLRGRDRSADVERTLPLSHIVGVRPVG